MDKGRILAIDDEAFFRNLYRELLGGEGYHVRAVATGSEGLDWLRREEFDLVITDMDMADRNGLEISSAIKRFNPDQEIMVVTALEEVSLAVEAMKRGVGEYLLKPINPDEFLLVVNRILFRQSLSLEHQRLLAENLEFSAMLVHYRKCQAFLKVFDLDRLADLIVDTLMELLRAEGGALWLAGYAGRTFRLRSRRGLVKILPGSEQLTPEDAPGTGRNDGAALFVDAGRGLWLPLRSEHETLALVRIEAPVGRDTFNRSDLKVAGLIGEFAASALHNVLHCRSLEHDSLRLPRSDVYKTVYFREHAEKELHKAHRYQRNVSLVRLVVDNYAELADRFHRRHLDAAVTRLVETVNTALRDADVMAMPEPGSFLILLPETDFWGSLMSQKRIRRALAGQLGLGDLRQDASLRVFLRSASCPADGTTLDQLVESAGERLGRLKTSLWHEGRFEEASFWAVVATLLGRGRDYVFTGTGLEVSSRLASYERPLSGRFLRMPSVRLEEVTASFCREVVESRRVRGVLYLGCDDFDQARRRLGFVEALEQSATSLFLLGGQRRVDWGYQRVSPIHIDDPNFAKITFLLYLNEDCAYGLFARRRGSELVGFHTSDFPFVENMIAKLQEQYQLQPRI